MALGKGNQTGSVAMASGGYFFVIDCTMNPEYTSPTQMIWVPLLLCMIRNSSWRVSFAAKLEAKTTGR